MVVRRACGLRSWKECLYPTDKGLLFLRDVVGGVFCVLLGVCEVVCELVVECFEVEGVCAVVLYEQLGGAVGGEGVSCI